MANVRAYLMSFVALQIATGRDRFATRFPHAWMVWEPGAWLVPKAPSQRTQIPVNASEPGHGDALCFELNVAPGGKIVLGRADAHALVINDATFSRDQFVLARLATDGWLIAAMPSAKACTLDGAPLSQAPVRLTSGASLHAGNVTLRFYEPFDFVARVDSEIKSGKL